MIAARLPGDYPNKVLYALDDDLSTLNKTSNGQSAHNHNNKNKSRCQLGWYFVRQTIDNVNEACLLRDLITMNGIYVSGKYNC